MANSSGPIQHPENVSDTGPKEQTCSIVLRYDFGRSFPVHVYIGDCHENIAKKFCEMQKDLYGKENYYVETVPCFDEV